jgi:hypothetical protein
MISPIFRSVARSSTTTKCHGCRLIELAESRPASTILRTTSGYTGVSA